MNRERGAIRRISAEPPCTDVDVFEAARDYCDAAAGQEGKANPATHIVAQRIVGSALDGNSLTAVSVASVNQMNHGIKTLS